MSKAKLFIFLFFISILLISLTSAKTIWDYDNFQNRYKVYKSATCNIFGTKTCPSELGWQGKSITFKFKDNSGLLSNVTDTLRFKFYISYFISNKPLDVYVNNVKIAQDFTPSNSSYSFEFPKSLLKPGKSNNIKIVMKNTKVGYGESSQGFVIDQAILETV